MIPDDGAGVARLLSALPQAQSDEARSARVRARCKAALLTRQSSGKRSTKMGRPAGVALAVTSGFCLIYLSAVVLLALRFKGIL